MQLVFFRLHLMLHARIARFDVMGTVALFGKTFRELNKGERKDCKNMYVCCFLLEKE